MITTLLVLISTISIIALSIGWIYRQRIDSQLAAVVVLGDIGRSPRCMYHALSLLENGYEVMLVGYEASTPIKQLVHNDRVKIKSIYIPDTKGLPFAFTALIKVAYQIYGLLALFTSSHHIPRWTLVQTPPAIPTLAVAQLLRIVTGTGLIIDWHNTAFSLLALKIGKKHPLAILSRAIESFTGKLADIHVFVTDAMRMHLSSKWGLIGTKLTLHDRPPSLFKRLPENERKTLLTKLNLIDDPKFIPSSSETDIKTAVIVSSTSWTPDENFDMLLSALEVYENASKKNTHLPNILLAITGKGPLKAQFDERVSKLETGWTNVRVRTVWLEASDYPKLLGSAHLGLSFHASSSGLDLPMKVVDMFGAGLPVCALNFACLHELVVDGVNGLTFESGTQLGQQLVDLLASNSRLVKLRNNVINSNEADWQTNWNEKLNDLLE
ncbi:hypothetical protein E3Q03_03999 [Wallemia mellicola]|uniref:Chitobiosyldiphosphodolichol beta-mannosyltransferase n=1 Tax=Wallemia mellicola TaxID=1708541 RepID=A0AB74K8M6_9BASI|nr:hypothetical protein E3Q03_03999 [Wallemia mellicola]